MKLNRTITHIHNYTHRDTPRSILHKYFSSTLHARKGIKDSRAPLHNSRPRSILFLPDNLLITLKNPSICRVLLSVRFVLGTVFQQIIAHTLFITRADRRVTTSVIDLRNRTIGRSCAKYQLLSVEMNGSTRAGARQRILCAEQFAEQLGSVETKREAFSSIRKLDAGA